METDPMLHIEVDIEPEQEAEFREMLSELVAGQRPRTAALQTEAQDIAAQAFRSFDSILEAIARDPASGTAPGPRQCRRLVHFLAALTDPTHYSLNLTELRAMDPVLSRACLDCLNYFRLALSDIPEWSVQHRQTLDGLFEKYGVPPA